MVNGQKMSKSKRNFFTVRDVLEGRATGREVHPAVLRYELIKTHYRASSNFTPQGLQDSGKAVNRLQRLHETARSAVEGEAAGELPLDHPVVARFISALSDDLNMSAGLAVVFEWLNDLGETVGDPRETLGVLARIDTVLGVLPAPGGETGRITEDVATLARQIDDARAGKDFAKADALRQRLLDAGYKVLTTKEGTKVEKPLA
jgi:cysteinyl-tRNA synthetase